MSSSVSSRPAIAADGEEAGRITAPIRWGQRRVATPSANSDLLPPMRWDQLEAVLTAMASTSDRALMVRHLLAGARRDADRLPVEETIRDILCIGAAAATGEPAVRPAA
ncbi:hypothetical protein [Brevundimonas viscosa]|uniref:Uncharacterized protein n=1 Tax=Brevundimonas viscosa TaxID=871741 RepID=A0A1I6QK38_9CAUL|nr:hypothetical protein [Brevundimonas viscosa]SFS52831.1 hypothetical protein SAMN05192570_1906 [Brevundimonas viscosa]